MADHLSLLEDKLDKLYDQLYGRIGDVRFVKDWSDYNFRAGYLEAIRDVGVMIREVRVPAESIPADGIADVLTPPEAEFIDG